MVCVKKTFIVLIVSFSHLTVFGFISNENQDTVKIKLLLIESKEPVIGASLYLKNSSRTFLGMSDLDGEATLCIPIDKKNVIIISMLGPYIELKIIRPVDFIIFDINAKKATYYFNNKKIRTKKQLVKGY